MRRVAIIVAGVVMCGGGGNGGPTRSLLVNKHLERI